MRSEQRRCHCLLVAEYVLQPARLHPRKASCKYDNSPTSDGQEHNRTLSVNLEQHAAVLERLIGLNAELMDQVNARTAAKLRTAQPLPGVEQVLHLPLI